MNTAKVTDYLVDWLREQVKAAGCIGVVFGISGGVDSAVAGAIAQRAFQDKCMGLLLPCESIASDILDAQFFAETFTIPYHLLELDDPYKLLLNKFESFDTLEGDQGRLLKNNIKPRLRMLSLYYFAQAKNYLVLGTSNKSEITVGYATKYGDSGVDLQILGDLSKEEVYELANYLQIPAAIIDKAPSAGLWSGQTDEGEMGFTYQDINQFIETGQGNPNIVKKIQDMNRKSEHKRNVPPIAKIPTELREQK